MDDSDLEFLNDEIFGSSSFVDRPSCSSLGSFLDGILKDTHACTHAHTCNPPGPDNSHTHTCFHVHRKVVSPPAEQKTDIDDTAEYTEKKAKKRPSGNREAVRRYREKKKEKFASLEEEVVQLRALNEQLEKKIQGQAPLEAENLRLKYLLVNISGRIEAEIGSFPYHRANNTNEDVCPGFVNPNLPYAMNPCNLQCDDQVYCLHPGAEGKHAGGADLNGQDFNNCELENLRCLGGQNPGLEVLPACGMGNDVPSASTSRKVRKRGRAAG